MSSTTEEHIMLQNSALVFDLPRVLFIEISGKDAERYLQGRITQDVQNLKSGQGKCSLLLTPNGKIRGHFAIFRKTDDSFAMMCDPLTNDEQEEFLKELFLFKVADDVEIVSPSEPHRVLSLQGAHALDILQEAGAKDIPTETLSHCKVPLTNCDALIISHARGSVSGYDLVLKESLVEPFLEDLRFHGEAVRLGSEETLERLRIESGIPRFGMELNDKILAPDIPLDSLVSFSKGCYAGQEVVEMAIARGRPNRKLVILAGKGAICPSPGTALTCRDKSGKEVSAGFITSSCLASSESNVSCLGFIKTSFENEATFFANTLELAPC